MAVAVETVDFEGRQSLVMSRMSIALEKDGQVDVGAILKRWLEMGYPLYSADIVSYPDPEYNIPCVIGTVERVITARHLIVPSVDGGKTALLVRLRLEQKHKDRPEFKLHQESDPERERKRIKLDDKDEAKKSAENSDSLSKRNTRDLKKTVNDLAIELKAVKDNAKAMSDIYKEWSVKQSTFCTWKKEFEIVASKDIALPEEVLNRPVQYILKLSGYNERKKMARKARRQAVEEAKTISLPVPSTPTS
eukprot:GILK01005749.1.p1 GENE.GILK01005749.1~~GILK01005749.1.p1  ORF type:complete len:290 (-),score=43.58 GILK01005749.1:156-902(-)